MNTYKLGRAVLGDTTTLVANLSMYVEWVEAAMYLVL